MYFPQQTKKDCVLILHICKLNVLTKLHEKQDAGKNVLKERKNAKRKNKNFRMFPAPETATNKPPTHYESHRPKKPCDHHSKHHHHSATDAPQSARRGATGIIQNRALKNDSTNRTERSKTT